MCIHQASLLLTYQASRLLSSVPVSDSLFQPNSCTTLLFLLLIQCADSNLLHALYLRFIHSCVAFCFSFHVSARLYSFMCCILPPLSCISQALFIHALHSASLFMYQPAFIYSCTSFCLSLHISATKPGVSLTYLSPWHLSRQAPSFIFRRYEQMGIRPPAGQYGRSLV